MKRLFCLLFLMVMACVADVRPEPPADITEGVYGAVVGLLSSHDRAYCTGVLVSEHEFDYRLLTAAHCVGDEPDVQVGLYRDFSERTNWATSYRFEVVALDDANDLAVLRPDELILNPPAPLRMAPGVPARGSYAVTIGHPLGLPYTATTGIVAVPTRHDRVWEGITWTQATTPVAPGNSGGPLLNYYGEIIGITSFRAVTQHSDQPHLAGFVHWSVIKRLLKGESDE